jgi:hypothetical protein
MKSKEISRDVEPIADVVNNSLSKKIAVSALKARLLLGDRSKLLA